MFPCETCGHPLNLHDPCSATVGKGKKARPCPCQAFQPADQKLRVAVLTDLRDEKPPAQLAHEFAVEMSRRKA